MKRRVHARTSVAMGTLVTVQVVGADDRAAERDAAIGRALQWFDAIEACCSRFDPASELMQLAHHPGEAVPASRTLFEAVRFAVAVAEETDGAFDPTVGRAMEARGFNRDHRTLETVESGLPDDRSVSYRDIRLDPERQTITLLRPLVLDLGAVAKGLAVDAAARELASFENYAVDAGGDLYLAGTNADGEPWRVGIRHPRVDTAIVDAIRVSDRAVCTSGDYERRAADGAGHILDARSREPAAGVVSVTVVAGTAMLADAAATAAFAVGAPGSIGLLERLGVEGLVISSTLECFVTRGMPGESASTILPDAQGAADDRSPDPDRRRGAD